MEKVAFGEGSLLEEAIEDSLLDGLSGISFDDEDKLMSLDSSSYQDEWEQ